MHKPYTAPSDAQHSRVSLSRFRQQDAICKTNVQECAPRSLRSVLRTSARQVRFTNLNPPLLMDIGHKVWKDSPPWSWASNGWQAALHVLEVVVIFIRQVVPIC